MSGPEGERLRRYAPFFRAAGHRGLVLGGMTARVPIAMRALGMVVMVSAVTGSYWSAGVAAGLCTGAQAIGSPLWAGLAHRRGVPAVTLLSGLLVVVWSALATVAVHTRFSIFGVYAAAALLGACALPVGAVTRALWTSVLGTEKLNAAFALEGIQDEISYLAGPALVVSLDVAVFPGAGIALAALLHLAGMLLVGRRSAQLGHTLRDTESNDGGTRVGAVLRRVEVMPLIVAYVFVGVLFGALDVGLVARAQQEGFAQHTGWLLSMLAVGSVVAGITYGSLTVTFDRVRVFTLGTLLVASSLLPLTVFTCPVPIAINLIVTGLFVAPVLISANELLVTFVGARETVVGLAVLSSSITVGMAFGSAAGGGLVDSQSPAAALILASVGAALAALIMGLVWWRRESHSG